EKSARIFTKFHFSRAADSCSGPLAWQEPASLVFGRHLTQTGVLRQNVYVRVISLKLLREFWSRHPDSEAPLRQWFRVATAASWSALKDVRQAYPHADGVLTRRGELLTIFNIGGNKYRLIARIRYDYQLI